MTWRLAKSLDVLRAEVNKAHPNRPKTADGTIGDARHQAEKSDHNPTAPHLGVVTAWDITTADFTDALAETLRLMGKGGDLRVKYVIYKGRICSAKQSWAWRTYTGYSQHFDHIHLSVSDDREQYDRTDPWLTKVTANATVQPAPLPAVEARMIVRFSSKPDIWEVVGSHLEHVTLDAFHARGLTGHDVQVLPDAHPLNKLEKR
jgi:hypothetical protein